VSATVYRMYASAPERRKLAQVVTTLRDGGVILYPADTGFAFGCTLSNKEGIRRIRAIRRLDDKKLLTFLCASLSDLASFALVDDPDYRLLKRLVPGPFTFVLAATKSVPRFAQNPKRKTAGLRVPDDRLCQLLLEALEAPLISITAKDEDGDYIEDPDELLDRFGKRIDAAVFLDNYDFAGESSVVDLSRGTPTLIRAGAGIERLREHIDLDDEDG